jgi:hypothetical protein
LEAGALLELSESLSPDCYEWLLDGEAVGMDEVVTEPMNAKHRCIQIHRYTGREHGA